MADETEVAAPATEPTQEDLAALWQEESARRANPDGEGSPPAAAAPAQPAVVEPPPAPELPEELRAALASVNDLKALVGNLQHQVRTSDGRVGALQRELQQARTAAAQTTGRAPNDQAVRAAAATPEKWATLKNEFPEWGEAVESLVDTVRQQQQPVDLTPLQNEIQGSINKIVQDFHWAVEEAKLYGAYPKYKTIVNDPEFKTWWAGQPPEIQALTASPEAEKAVRALDLFHEAKQAARDAARNVPQERGARLAAAARPATRVAAPPPQAETELTAEQLWAAEAARRAEIRARRI